MDNGIERGMERRNLAGCMALVDYDPFFWPDVKKGESLFIHKLAVTKTARKSGVADALMDFFKKQGAERGVKTLRLDTHALRPKLRAFYELHGFAFVKVKVFKGDRHTAFYIYTLPNSVLAQNKSSWNTMADSWFGVTALPTYGCLCPNEDELHLFPDLNDKKVLDIGCGSWDHPLMHCVEAKDGQLIFSGSYYEAEPFSYIQRGNPVTLLNRRLSDTGCRVFIGLLRTV